MVHHIIHRQFFGRWFRENSVRAYIDKYDECCQYELTTQSLEIYKKEI